MILFRAHGGAGQRPGSDELVAAKFVAEVKGRDLMVDRFADLLGVTSPADDALVGW